MSDASSVEKKMEKKLEFMYKAIVIGDAQVGKSNMLETHKAGKPKEHWGATASVDHFRKVVTLRGKEGVVNIWDTAGQERFKANTKIMFRGIASAMLVYDVTSKESFDNCKMWLPDLKEKAPNVTVVLAGNKADKADDERQVTSDEGSQFAMEHNMLFFETSAWTGLNIEEVFWALYEKTFDADPRWAPTPTAPTTAPTPAPTPARPNVTLQPNVNPQPQSWNCC